jgi:LacI family transcriptional regulator
MMLGSPATLRDVAERAGVHPSTASRALNPSTRSLVNEDTVSRVLEAARQLGYRPNSLARALKTNRTFTIGMLVPDLTNPLFPPIVRGIEDSLGEADYTLILANTDNDAQKEHSIVRTMLARRVDGLILATAQRKAPVIDELIEAGMPVVLVNRTMDEPRVPSVTGDDHAGIGLAVRHLVSLGHRRIAHVAGPQHVTTGLTRYQSFIAWMKSEGQEPDPELIVFAEWFSEEPGAKAFQELIDRRDDFTAVVAANDLIAIGCYDVLKERDLRVAVDVSVVGYNDILFADKLSPPLTTIHIPHYQIGVKAAELILQVIEAGESSPVAVRLAPSLVVRHSTGPAPSS